MTTIVTRSDKGSSLSWAEMDTNLNNLNADKLEASALTPYATTATVTAGLAAKINTSEIGVSVQAHSANLDEYATVNPTSAGLALLDDADNVAQRATLGLVIGTDVQAYDADIPTVAASQAEMEAGTETALRSMSPLRVKQAISALSSNGAVVKVVEATPYTTATSFTAIIPGDSTIPQNTEGQEFITATITPSSASNRLSIEFDASMVDGAAAIGIIVALFKDANANAIAASYYTVASNDYTAQIRLRHEMAAGSTSAITFKIRLGVSSSTGYVNRRASGATLGGTPALRLRITETTP
jgi:hypothetical protein